MRNFRHIIPLMLLAACAQNAPPASVTTTAPISPAAPLESPAPEGTGAATQAPTIYSTSVIASPSPGATPTPTPTAAQLFGADFDFPEAEIQLFVPGPLSRLGSPFRLSGNLEPGPEYRVSIELLGEDGRTLVRKIIRALPPAGAVRADFLSTIEFEIDALSESARLVVSVQDEFQRTWALASMPLVLLSEGINLYNPYPDTYESIIIQKPGLKAKIEGGSLIVSGLARPQENDILVVELVDQRGVVIASRLALVVVPQGEQYGLFVVELPYSVSQSTPVLLVVREEGVEIPGPVHVSSTEITISP